MGMDNSNLTSILQTLSSYSQPAAHPVPNPRDEPDDDLEEGEYDPSDYTPSNIHPVANHTPPTATRPTTIPQPHPKIETYPQALQHITLTLLPHSTLNLRRRIRALRQTQHSHEKQWATGRAQLKEQIGKRRESRRRLDAVLASVSASARAVAGHTESNKVRREDQEDDDKDEKSERTSEASKIKKERIEVGSADEDEDEEAKNEMKRHDEKVYMAQKEMVRDAERELARLGVPFFTSTADSTVTLDGAEKRKLQAQVLAFLEDLCSGED